MWKDDFSSIARQQEAKKMQAGCAFRGRDLIFLFIAKGKLSTQAQGSGRMLRWEISLSIALGPVILSLFSVRASHRICIESSFLVPGKMFVTSRSALISIFGHVLQGSIGSVSSCTLRVCVWVLFSSELNCSSLSSCHRYRLSVYSMFCWNRTVRCRIIHSNLVLDVLAKQVFPASRYVLSFSLALYSLDQIVQLQQAIGKEAAAYCHKWGVLCL